MIPVVATSQTFGLAEGPVWDPVRQRLHWVDIVAGAVLVGRLDEAAVAAGRPGAITVTGRHELGEMAGAVALAPDGGLLVAGQERLHLLPDGVPEQPTGQQTGPDRPVASVPGPRIVPPDAGRRLNDGGTDPAGRYLVGTLALAGDSAREQLVRLEPDGRLTVLDDDLTLSNGLAWSLEGDLLYSVDSGRHRVNVRDYAADGGVGPRRVHLELADGTPDGIALDAEDHLWVAVHGLGQVRRYTPDGVEVDRLELPAPHTTCVAFAGHDLDVLVITTAHAELAPDQQQHYPESGRLFVARPGVTGAPVPAWAGAALTAER